MLTSHPCATVFYGPIVPLECTHSDPSIKIKLLKVGFQIPSKNVLIVVCLEKKIQKC